MDKSKPNPDLKIVKPKFSEKFKSKNAPTIGGVQTLQAALPILKIGDVDDFMRTHPSEEEYWTPEMCFVEVPIAGAKRALLHAIDDDLAIKWLPAKKIKRFRLALAAKPNDVFFWLRVPSQNLDNAYNVDAIKACYMAQTQWVQALSKQSTGVEGYEIKFSFDHDGFFDPNWPKPDKDELLEVTFKETNIDHDRHPGLLRLIGAKQNLT